MTSTSTSAGAPFRAPLRRAPTALRRPARTGALAAVLALALVGCSSATAGDDAGSASGSDGPVLESTHDAGTLDADTLDADTLDPGTLDPGTLVPSVSPGPVRAPAQRLDAAPAPGTVRVEPGPFTDRLAFTGLTVRDGQVTGRAGNAVDVSELIVLELHSDFYDAGGRLLGSGAAAYADEEFADNGATALEHGTGLQDETFDIVVPSRPRLAGAVSAVLTVPQLVNE